jgi:hypothetical protein
MTMTATHFLNVDLNIEFKKQGHLKILKAELLRRIVIIAEGPVNPGCFLLRLEVVPEYENPDDTICAFCFLLENLAAKGKGAWRSAHKKEFNVGCEADLSQAASQLSLGTETIKRIAKVGATLGVTVYHPPIKTQKRKMFPP